MKKVVDRFEADQAGVPPPPRAERAHNYDSVADLVAERVEKPHGRISDKRLLPIAKTTDYAGFRVLTTGWVLNRRQHRA